MAAKIKGLTYAEAYADYWTAQPIDADALVVASGGDRLGCSRVTLKYTRSTPGAVREDLAMTSLWVAKAVGGGLYSAVPLAELATLETALNTYSSAIANAQSNQYTLVEYSWHQVFEDSPRTDDDEHRGQKMGPATRVTVKAVSGATTGARLPDQVSSTITLRTVSRHHWGRTYIPGLPSNILGATGGRLLNANVDFLANSLNALHDTWQTAGYQLGVWSMWKPAFMTPKQIECDDILDVIRRRRAKTTGYRAILS